ncbi:hypothetical protein [Elizabethkingia anophelis]
MAIIKNANNINIQVSGDYTSICKVSHEESEEVILEATKQNLELSSQKRAIMQGFGQEGERKEDDTNSKGQITEMYWTYGEGNIRITESSRFFTDLNLVILTEGYKDGESIEVTIKADDGKPLAERLDELKLTGTIDNEKVIFKEPLKGYSLFFEEAENG